MIIKRAKTQGFCFGVAITVKKAEEAVERLGADVTTLGHVVHNPQMVAALEAKGLKNADTVDEDDVDDLPVCGLGLALVAASASCWGYHEAGPGRTVWAEASWPVAVLAAHRAPWATAPRGWRDGGGAA